MQNFKTRATIHDDIAVPLVTQWLDLVGFECYVLGTEGDSKKLRQALMSQSDPTSIMLRFRPDRTFINRGFRSVLCEIKSELRRYNNFAVEIDSYAAARKWNTSANNVMLAFVELDYWRMRDTVATKLSKPSPLVSEADVASRDWFSWLNYYSICGCWAQDIPEPTTIYVPRRWDWQKSWQRLRYEWPRATLRDTDHKSGSGTPYFLIDKQAQFLTNLPTFIIKMQP